MMGRDVAGERVPDGCVPRGPYANLTDEQDKVGWGEEAGKAPLSRMETQSDPR